MRLISHVFPMVTSDGEKSTLARNANDQTLILTLSTFVTNRHEPEGKLVHLSNK
jgi:hypothetical protein